MKHLKTLEKYLGSMVVKSLADGNMLIAIKYNIDPSEDGATPVGVFTRLEIAKEIEDLLYEHTQKIRLRRKK